MKMKGSSFIRTISSLLLAAKRYSSPAVTPLPQESEFVRQIIAQIDVIGSSDADVGSGDWLSEILDAIIATQKITHESLVGNHSSLSVSDKEMINNYLEDNIELLDACNGLLEKMSVIRDYITSLEMAARSTQVREALSKCDELKNECAKLDKCNSKLSRMMGRTCNQVGDSNELHEVLTMSKDVALVVCHRLQKSLSFKSKPKFLNFQSNASSNGVSFMNGLADSAEEQSDEQKKRVTPLMMNELEELVMTSRMFYDQVKSRKGNAHAYLSRGCYEQLEGRLKPLEERVKDLYKHLISIRMVLLGKLSYD